MKKPTAEQIKALLALAEDLCPSAPCNVYTYVKEWQMCWRLNDRFDGADYQPHPKHNHKGIDLIDNNKIFPVVQLKSPRTSSYRGGADDKMSKIARAAMAYDKEALIVVEFQLFNETYIGKASLLLKKDSIGLSPNQARKLGFELMSPV